MQKYIDTCRFLFIVNNIKIPRIFLNQECEITGWATATPLKESEYEYDVNVA